MSARVPQVTEPKLLEQLKELREEWGEGFDEDIATPLAKIILHLRTALEEKDDRHESKRDDLYNQIDELTNQLEFEGNSRDAYTTLVAMLQDVGRGVRTVEEVVAFSAPVRTP